MLHLAAPRGSVPCSAPQSPGIKAHSLPDLHGGIPAFIHLSEAKPHDVKVLERLIPKPGAIYVMDGAFSDFNKYKRRKGQMTYQSIVIGLFACLLCTQSVSAEMLDPTDPKDALTIQRKIMCSTVDGEPSTFWWQGRAYSRRQGERDRLLFLVEGMNIRACITDAHPERGQGYKMVSRELLIYRDPATGESLSTWENPWTGKVVDVLHVANDPVNHSAYEIGRDGKPFQWSGSITEGQWRMNITVPLFYPNPLASAYQEEIGGTYHATEMFNFFGEVGELLDPETTTVARQVGWARVSDWLPWMKMQGREGIIYMHTAGLRLSSWDAMPERMKQEIETHYPDYTQPPPLDDDRVNVTSWMYYKRVGEGEEVPPVRGE